MARPSKSSPGNEAWRFKKSVCGIGYIGNASKTNNVKAYTCWWNMLNRCYNPDNKDYRSYMAKGITVDAPWHSFEIFLNDIVLLPGWDKIKFIKNEIQIDKDIICNGIEVKRIYSKNTCQWVSPSDNLEEMKKTIQIGQKDFIAISPTGEVFESNNQVRFSLDHNLNRKILNAILNGKYKNDTYKKWKFVFKSCPTDCSM